eukprot:TRINITY_DN112859_c0_g1_i1.p1 TRINITY_DN112859_c0_g1~~TRINITY_DN112859_c0_g1_i1.p1  ORF type:complete len:176 (-),score=77.90 TRINITY_DN112859_c0_g1_i1:3-530(-)
MLSTVWVCVAVVGAVLTAACVWVLLPQKEVVVIEPTPDGRIPVDFVTMMLRNLFSPFKKLKTDVTTDGTYVPKLKTHVNNLAIDLALVAGLRKLRETDSSFADATKSEAGQAAMREEDEQGLVPFLYFEVVTFPLIIKMCGHSAFPFVSLGSVHARNVITRFKHVPLDAKVDLTM